MWFSRAEIAAAVKLRDLGLEWRPQPGLFIWDETHRIRPSSPFQRGVYFLLDVQCFVDYFGGAQQLQQAVVWLPTWEQSRQLLTRCGLEAEEVAVRLRAAESLERIALYRLLVQEYERTASTGPFPVQHA